MKPERIAELRKCQRPFNDLKNAEHQMIEDALPELLDAAELVETSFRMIDKFRHKAEEAEGKAIWLQACLNAKDEMLAAAQEREKRLERAIQEQCDTIVGDQEVYAKLQSEVAAIKITSKKIWDARKRLNKIDGYDHPKEYRQADAEWGAAKEALFDTIADTTAGAAFLAEKRAAETALKQIAEAEPGEYEYERPGREWLGTATCDRCEELIEIAKKTIGGGTSGD